MTLQNCDPAELLHLGRSNVGESWALLTHLLSSWTDAGFPMEIKFQGFRISSPKIARIKALCEHLQCHYRFADSHPGSRSQEWMSTGFPRTRKLTFFGPSAPNMAAAQTRHQGHVDITYHSLGAYYEIGELRFDSDGGSASAISQPDRIAFRLALSTRLLPARFP